MKIGLFFGSFDPVTIGHMEAITTVLNEGMVDKVRVVVAYHNPHKEKAPLVASHRINMLESIYGKDTTVKSRIYIDGETEFRMKILGEEPYTYNVLNHIKNDEDTYYIIMSNYEFANLHTWYNGLNIIRKNSFILFHRPGDKDYDEYQYLQNQVLCTNGTPNVIKLLTSNFNVSSTMIRNLIKEDKIILPYTTREVAEYIHENNLYNEELSNQD